MKSRKPSARAVLAILATTLDVGETEATLCPYCNGGRSGERSCYVTRATQATALYICHRASCGQAGRLTLAGHAPEATQPRATTTRAAWQGGFANDLPGWYYGRYHRAVGSKLGIAPSVFGLFRQSGTENIVWVLRNIYTERVGVQVRGETDAGKKWVRTYKESERTPYYFLRGFQGDGSYTKPPGALWIVEDPLSAAALAQHGVDACALLGTVLHDDVRGDLLRLPRTHIVVALDPGAEFAGKAVRDSLALYTVKPVYQIYLPKDFKDMVPVEQQETIYRGSL